VKVISWPIACANSCTGSTCKPLLCVRRPTSLGCGLCSRSHHHRALRSACDPRASSACSAHTTFAA